MPSSLLSKGERTGAIQGKLSSMKSCDQDGLNVLTFSDIQSWLSWGQGPRGPQRPGILWRWTLKDEREPKKKCHAKIEMFFRSQKTLFVTLQLTEQSLCEFSSSNCLYPRNHFDILLPVQNNWEPLPFQEMWDIKSLVGHTPGPYT